MITFLAYKCRVLKNIKYVPHTHTISLNFFIHTMKTTASECCKNTLHSKIGKVKFAHPSPCPSFNKKKVF